MLKNIAALSGASFLFATLAVASTNSKADQACRGYHGPNWEAVLDDNGDPDDCRMITKEKKCFPTLDSETKKWVCCPAGTKAVSDSQTGVSACCGTDQSLSVNPQSKTGGCCEYGSHWSHNIKVEKGACCKPGYDFNGLYCFETYPKPPHPSPTTGLTSTNVGECLMVCPAGVVASTTGSPTPSPLPTDIHTGKGFPQCDHDGSGKCLGMNLHPWQTGRDVILAGSSVQLPPIQWEWAGGYRPVDSEFRFVEDTWLAFTTWGNVQSPVRIYADGRLVGDATSHGSVKDCSNKYDECFKDASHSSGRFFIPAGTRNVTVQNLDHVLLNQYSTRYDFVCSNRTPCLGDRLLPWTQFTVLPVTNSDKSTPFAVAPDFEYSKDVILTLSDNLYLAEQYTLYLDGKPYGATHGPAYLTEDNFINDRAYCESNLMEHCISWGAYWRSYLIPAGHHSIEWRMTAGKKTFANGGVWPYFGGAYTVHDVCSCKKPAHQEL